MKKLYREIYTEDIMNKIKYIPLGSYILIEKLPPEQPKSGVIISTTAPKDHNIAIIVEIGSECRNEVLDTGDKVKYLPYKAIPVLDDDQPNLFLVEEKDIICLINEV